MFCSTLARKGEALRIADDNDDNDDDDDGDSDGNGHIRVFFYGVF